MTTPAYAFDKTRQRSTLDRTSDISTDVDAVVIGTCSPALLFGLKTLVDTTPDLRFVGSANTLHDFIETCTRAGRCIALAVAHLFRAARAAGAAARGLRIAGNPTSGAGSGGGSAGSGTWHAFDAERARPGITSASVPALEAAVLRARCRLSRLCGEPPTAFDAELSTPKPLPGLKSVALGGIGSPESLLCRRPDILAAEQQPLRPRASAWRAELFPRITLGGTIGLNALTPGTLGNGAAHAYSLGAQMVWNLLDFGRIRAQIAAADARGDAAMLVYERTVLIALEETEGALATYTRSQRQAEHLYGAARAAENAALVTRERFTAGVSDS